MTSTDVFSRDTTGLAEVGRPSLYRLRHGDRLALDITPVVKTIGGNRLRMIAYNGSIPGPTLHVDQGSEVVVDVRNNGDLDTTVHWHGLRLDNAYDGVPMDTQAPIGVGETFSYRVRFPDPGFYWYHPHLREDYAQEMGLYGTIIVEPSDPAYWQRVDRQLAVTLDDLLIEDGRIAPFRRSGPTFTAMGRFGNVLLVNGEEQLTAEVTLGDVVRLHLVNTANTRIFNVAIPGARMKLVGGDSGRYQRETLVEEVRLAPSERAIVDVLFDRAGEVRLEHHTPDASSVLGTFSVASSRHSFETLRVDEELTNVAATLPRHRDRAPDRMLAFRSRMPLLYPSPDGTTEAPDETARAYRCPMHPEVTSTQPSRCPTCGMKLVPMASEATSYACPMHPEVTAGEASRCPKCGMKLVLSSSAARDDGLPSAATAMHSASAVGVAPGTYSCPMHPEITGTGPTECPICGMWLTPIQPSTADVATANAGDPLPGHRARSTDQPRGLDADREHGHLDGDGLEWEDLMPDINRQSTPENMHWSLTDLGTGAENADIFWTFTVGDEVKIRLVNELESDHPMHHPFHVHGAGRFLILARDGIADDNLVWKDTVLVAAGETVDILLDVTNPGRWMAHCHIAEHIESGMMFSFDVLPAKAAR